MTRDVTEMVRDAGFGGGIVEFIGLPVFERFAELVRKDYSTTHANIWLDRIHKFMLEEREACAKVCDEKVDAEYATGKVDHNEMGWTQACAIAIRARGQA